MCAKKEKNDNNKTVHNWTERVKGKNDKRLYLCKT